MRFPKVRTTDYRPTAGRRPPLERPARPGAAACHEDAEHDKWVSTLSREACIGAALFLSLRPMRSVPWQERHWCELRAAALRRRIVREGWNERGLATAPQDSDS